MEPHRRIFRATLIYSSLLFANELATNLAQIYGKFASGIRAHKVFSSFTTVVAPAFKLLAAELAGMFLVAGLLTALIAVAWAAASVIAMDAATAIFPATRARRVAFWFVSGFAFFNVYYSLHSLAFPYSTLTQSPLAVSAGALDPRLSPGNGALLVTGVLAVIVTTIITAAAVRSKQFRVALGTGVCTLLLVAGAYSRLAGVGEVKRFEIPGSIVMLGLDSFQLNRLPVGGSRYDDAPNINAFLQKSFRFDNAWTPFARTYPSWISILTGRYPTNHGVRFNLVADEHLDDGNRYLAAELGKLGYTTFHATDETRFSNIRPIFGYEEMLHPPMGLADFLIGEFFDFSAANFARQTHLGHNLFPAISNNRAVASYNPKIFTHNLIKRLNRLPRDQPVFATIHLCGNHWPFSVPAPYFYRSDDEVRNSIQMVDDQVGEIIAYLRASGLIENATTIMLSDHGDGWSGDPEDSANTHGDDLNHVWANRIILALRGHAIEPGVSTDLVRSIDLYPTTLELAGATAAAPGIDGLSLLPLAEGGTRPQRALFAESGFDKGVAQVQSMVQRYAGWYDFDPETRLITLKDGPYGLLMKRKSYMMVRGDRRLVASPFLSSVQLFAFDPISGAEHKLARTESNEAERRGMLRELTTHYGLDYREIFEVALRGKLAPASP